MNFHPLPKIHIKRIALHWCSVLTMDLASSSTTTANLRESNPSSAKTRAPPPNALKPITPPLTVHSLSMGISFSNDNWQLNIDRYRQKPHHQNPSLQLGSNKNHLAEILQFHTQWPFSWRLFTINHFYINSTTAKRLFAITLTTTKEAVSDPLFPSLVSANHSV